MKPIYLLIALLAATGCGPEPAPQPSPADPAATDPTAATASTAAAKTAEPVVVETPFDFDPYRVLVWWVCDDANVTAATIAPPLHDLLDREFHSLWRTSIRDAPPSVAAIACRSIADLSYDTITAPDPVLAIRRDHPNAVRLRTFDNVLEHVGKIDAPMWRSADLIAGMQAANHPAAEPLAAKFVDNADPADDVWAAGETEAILTSRGVAMTLTKPEAKIIDAPDDDAVTPIVEAEDKIFVCVASLQTDLPSLTVVELDRLMRHVGAATTMPMGESLEAQVDATAAAIRASFRPVVRIDGAGKKNATGTVRAGGLITADDSPAAIHVGDILEPMIRKEDRNGDPNSIGPLDWAFLIANEVNNPTVEMDFWSGRTGGLQGRQNNRTFRMGLRVRPRSQGSEMKLHAKGDPDDALVGYEIYEKNLETDEMAFVGRTDWRGTLQIMPSGDEPFRLLYVKNGGAVLARLPIVPGLHDQDVANLIGDDDRLQAEAYVKGAENSIIDLVAVRELYKARIMMRIERKELDQAEELLIALRAQPTSRELNDAIAKKKVQFLDSMNNKSQRAKVDRMFSQTQDLLIKFINPKMLQDLENEFLAAKKR